MLKEQKLRKAIILLSLSLTSAPAFAQSPDLEATCQSVAKGFFMTEKLAIGTVQSFPELKPPGARMTYATRASTAAADMTDTFECEFEKTDKPHELVKFCVSRTCYSANEADGDRKRRFEEAKTLLARSER